MTGVQTCALPICDDEGHAARGGDLNAVLGEGGEIGDEGVEVMDGQAIGLSLGEREVWTNLRLLCPTINRQSRRFEASIETIPS